MVFRFLQSSFQKVKNALAKTRARLGQKLRSLFSEEINEETLEELEQALYEADLGVKAALELTEAVKARHRKDSTMDAEQHITALKRDILDYFTRNSSSEIHEAAEERKPTVILIVGVNGSGKTTSIAKLAKKYVDSGKSVLVAAGDTFRAAAIEQLDVWAGRIGAGIVKAKPNSDPAAVAFDALSAAQARGTDVVIIDTAGRLHTKTSLMEELSKIRRACRKLQPEAPHETLLVLDATTGQNAIDQAKTFHQYTPITGLILTKLDGTAKGGLAVGIQKELEIPVKFIGVGEAEDDLEPFDPETFVNSLFD